MLTQEQRDFLLPRAYNAAVRAGAAILEHYNDGEDEMAVEIKKDHTPITVADRAAHECIKTHLGPTHIPVLSEEGREMLYEERRGWDLFWMVDPLDGTKEFLKGNGEFTVNIALMSDNKPVIGIVYVPHLGRMFFADTDKGSFRRTDVSPDKDANHSLVEIYAGAERLPVAGKTNTPVRIAISRSHNTSDTFRYIDMIKSDFPDAELVEQGSSYKFCLLAEGSVDCYIRTSQTYEWDTAAGELILAAAEGQTLSIPDLAPFAYNKESIVNPHFVCRSKHFTLDSIK